MLLDYSAKLNKIKGAIHMPNLKMDRFGPFIEIMGDFIKDAGSWNFCYGKFSIKCGVKQYPNNSPEGQNQERIGIGRNPKRKS